MNVRVVGAKLASGKNDAGAKATRKRKSSVGEYPGGRGIKRQWGKARNDQPAGASLCKKKQKKGRTDLNQRP